MKTLLLICVWAGAVLVAHPALAQDFVIHGATVHTATAQGTLKNTDVAGSRRCDRRDRSRCPGCRGRHRHRGPGQGTDAGIVRRIGRSRSRRGIRGIADRRFDAQHESSGLGAAMAPGVRGLASVQPSLHPRSGGSHRRNHLVDARSREWRRHHRRSRRGSHSRRPIRRAVLRGSGSLFVTIGEHRSSTRGRDSGGRVHAARAGDSRSPRARSGSAKALCCTAPDGRPCRAI